MDRALLKLRPHSFHVVTGHMGCLCSPETIWMCVCFHSRWITTLLSLNAVHSQVGPKTCTLMKSQDPMTTSATATSAVGAHAEMHKARMIPSDSDTLHLYANEIFHIWEGDVLY